MNILRRFKFNKLSEVFTPNTVAKLSYVVRDDIEMSHIDSTRKSYSFRYEITVCMTKEECKILLPFFQKAYKSVKSKYEKYNDIHNGGEATEREENLLMKYSEQLERLESVLSSIDEILKQERNETGIVI